MIALLARYHRRATPKADQDLIADLNRGTRKTG